MADETQVTTEEQRNSPGIAFITHGNLKHDPPLHAFITHGNLKHDPPLHAFITYAKGVDTDGEGEISTQLLNFSASAKKENNKTTIAISWNLNGLHHAVIRIKKVQAEADNEVDWSGVEVADTLTIGQGVTSTEYDGAQEGYKYQLEGVGVDVFGDTSEAANTPKAEVFIAKAVEPNPNPKPEPDPSPEQPTEKLFEFHYVPDEGVLPGLIFEQQTEDVINDIGNHAYFAQKTASKALKTGLEASEAARTALNAAQDAQSKADRVTELGNTGISKANAAQETADKALKKAEANEVSIAANSSSIATLQNTVNGQQTQLDGNLTNISGLKKQIAENKQSIDANSKGISQCIMTIQESQRYTTTDKTDANDLTDYGKIYLPNALLHCPSGVTYPVLLDVVPSYLDDDEIDDVVVQRVIDANGVSFYRFATETTVDATTTYTFGDWKSIDTRYLKLTGGTVTGQTTFSGKLTASGETSVPTLEAETNSDAIASTKFVHAVVNALVNGAPEALDTLKELSKALGDDPNFSTTILKKLEQVVTNVTNDNGKVTVSKGNGQTNEFYAGYISPNAYHRVALPSSAKTTISITQTVLAIGGAVYDGAGSLNLASESDWDDSTYATASNRAGKDFYIYACVADGALKFVLSANKDNPAGYTTATSRKIGGFHCLCVDVGTIENHPLSDYVAGDILPASMWDLLHRCKGDNEGMVYDEEDDVWLGIYLLSYEDGRAVSKYNGVVLDGTSTPKAHGLWFTETLAKQKMRLPYLHEYFNALKGCQEGVNISESKDWNTTGGHIYTNNVRCISNIGLEDPTGFMWQWTNNYGMAGGSSWGASSYDAKVDDVNRGNSYGNLWLPRIGGFWSDGVNCGSRSVNGSAIAAYTALNVGARSASEPRIVFL